MQKIRKGDEVIIRRGKDKGQTGVVLKVVDHGKRVIVEGLNLVTKHRRRTSETSKAGRISEPAPLPISAVSLISKIDGKPVRVHFEIREEGGVKRKVRVASRTGEVFD